MQEFGDIFEKIDYLEIKIQVLQAQNKNLSQENGSLKELVESQIIQVKNLEHENEYFYDLLKENNIEI